MTPDARLRLVLDTNVLVAAVRSRTGASYALLSLVEEEAFIPVASVALLIEYEAVLSRPEHATRRIEVEALLDFLAARVARTTIRYVWRPQLADVADEMVLEAAVNGRADAIVTFNVRDLHPARRFGVAVWTPAEAMGALRRGNR